MFELWTFWTTFQTKCLPSCTHRALERECRKLGAKIKFNRTNSSIKLQVNIIPYFQTFSHLISDEWQNNIQSLLKSFENCLRLLQFIQFKFILCAREKFCFDEIERKRLNTRLTSTVNSHTHTTDSLRLRCFSYQSIFYMQFNGIICLMDRRNDTLPSLAPITNYKWTGMEMGKLTNKMLVSQFDVDGISTENNWHF